MTRLILLRVYIDTNPDYGGYYSPMHDNGCTTLLPIKETNKLRDTPWFLDASQIMDKCSNVRLSRYYPIEWGSKVIVHNDPRPDLGFYTGHFAPKGRIPRRLGIGDYVLFIAGLARYPEGFWWRRRSKREIVRTFRLSLRNGLAGIYIVAYIKIHDIVEVWSWNSVVERYPQLRYSPHYYWVNKEHRTVAVIGESSYVDPPIIFYDFGTRKLNEEVVRVIGRDVAVNMIRNNFRKSRIVEVDEYGLQKLLGL